MYLIGRVAHGARVEINSDEAERSRSQPPVHADVAATRAGFGSRSTLFRNLRKSAAPAGAGITSALPEAASPCYLFA